MSSILRTALACLALALAACTSIPLDEATILDPKQTVTPDDYPRDGLDLTSFYIPAADTSVQLNVWHVTQPGAAGTVLLFGGQGFHMVQSKRYLDALTALPLDVVLWDYRGYGRSGGEPSVDALRRDALTVYDTIVAERGVRPGRLIVHGHSLGTFLATQVADERTVAGVVLQNPATTVEAWTDHLVPWPLEPFLNFDIAPALQQGDNIARVRQLQAPLLIYGGTEDVITAPAMAEELFDEAASAQKQLELLPGGHNDLWSADGYLAAYEAFLQNALTVTAPLP